MSLPRVPVVMAARSLAEVEAQAADMVASLAAALGAVFGGDPDEPTWCDAMRWQPAAGEEEWTP